MILNDSGAIEPPANVVRERPRVGLCCRNAAIISVLRPPFGCAQIAAQIVSWLIGHVGSSGCGVLSLHATCSGDAAYGGSTCPAQSHEASQPLQASLRRRPRRLRSAR